MSPWIPDGPLVLDGPAQALAAAVAVPTSKSLTNRALIAAAAAGGGTIHDALDCEDTRLLAAALAACGWSIRWDDELRVGARVRVTSGARLQLGNSGTGARFITSLLACMPGASVVDGSSRLRERPMVPLLDALSTLGAALRAAPGGRLPVTITGATLAGGALRMRPGVSSQFVSSLLLAAPLMTRGLELEIEGALPSRPYLDLTREVLTAFGGRVEELSPCRFKVAPGGLRPTSYTVEGDWSAAAFFGAAAAVAGGSVEVARVHMTSAQGDRVLCEILAGAGVTVVSTPTALIFRGPATRPLHADFSDAPDLFPALGVVAACVPGSSLSGLDHLQHKESDRLSVMVDNLQRLGARFARAGDRLQVVEAVHRRCVDSPIEVTAAQDHRIAMAMAVASLRVGPLRLDDPDCVRKSFPGFWEAWQQLRCGGCGSSPRTAGGS